VKDDTATKVRKLQHKFQHATDPLRTAMHTVAYKLIYSHCWTEINMETSNAE
jgi:hypothetical protein